MARRGSPTERLRGVRAGVLAGSIDAARRRSHSVVSTVAAPTAAAPRPAACHPATLASAGHEHGRRRPAQIAAEAVHRERMAQSRLARRGD